MRRWFNFLCEFLKCESFTDIIWHRLSQFLDLSHLITPMDVSRPYDSSLDLENLFADEDEESEDENAGEEGEEDRDEEDPFWK